MNVTPFKSEHFLDLDLQAAQRYARKEVTMSMLMELEMNESYTILDGSQPIACVGLVPIWYNRAYVWTALSCEMKFSFLKVHRICNELLDTANLMWHRIECYVNCDHMPGHRWAKLTGFKLETPKAEAFMPNGDDVSVYVRIR